MDVLAVARAAGHRRVDLHVFGVASIVTISVATAIGLAWPVTYEVVTLEQLDGVDREDLWTSVGWVALVALVYAGASFAAQWIVERRPPWPLGGRRGVGAKPRKPPIANALAAAAVGAAIFATPYVSTMGAHRILVEPAQWLHVSSPAGAMFTLIAMGVLWVFGYIIGIVLTAAWRRAREGDALSEHARGRSPAA